MKYVDLVTLDKRKRFYAAFFIDSKNVFYCM